MAGYSNTPLTVKLGIKEGTRVRTSGAPAYYLDLLEPLPDGAVVSARLRTAIDIWHVFTMRKATLSPRLRVAMSAIAQDGAIWVSWPKKASGVSSDMTGDEVRRAALPLGLVDIKVCAVDETWSGLKLVIRKSLRT